MSSSVLSVIKLIKFMLAKESNPTSFNLSDSFMLLISKISSISAIYAMYFIYVSSLTIKKLQIIFPSILELKISIRNSDA